MTNDKESHLTNEDHEPAHVPFPFPSVKEIALLAVIIATFGVVALLLIRQGTPLGHDESVYSLRARQFTMGTAPISYWRPYRAPGLPVVLQIAWLGPATEPYLRIIVAAFGIIVVASTWFLGRLLGGIRVGLIAAGGVAVSSLVLIGSTRVLPDIPGAALGLLTVSVYAWAVSRERVSKLLLLVPVLSLAAVLLRFGAPIPIAVGLVAITLWRYQAALKSRWLISVTAVLTLVVVSAVLFIPAATVWAQSPAYPGAPYAANAALRSASVLPWYQGFADYWSLRTYIVGGMAGTMLLVGLLIGLATALRHWRKCRDFWVALGAGGATVIVLAFVVHGEPRYLSPTLPWLWIAAAFGLAAVSRAWNREVGMAVGVTVLLLIGIDSHRRAYLQNEANTDRHQIVKEAAVSIDIVTDDGKCSVITGDTAIVGWYSKCPTNRYNTTTVDVEHPSFPEGPRFLFWIEGGARQPEDKVLNEYLQSTSGVPFTVGQPGDGRRQYVVVYEVDQ